MNERHLVPHESKIMTNARSAVVWIKADSPIARGTIRTSFVLGLRLIVQAGTLLIVARMLGPHEFGAFAGVAALAVMFGTVSTFGTHIVLLGEVSREPTRRNDVFRYAVPSTLFCGGLLLGIYLLLCTSVFYAAPITFSVLLAIGITEMWLQPLLGLPAWEHLALARTARSQLLMTLPFALRLIAALTAFTLRPADPLPLYAYGYLISTMIALVVATLTMSGAWPRIASWRWPSWAELRNSSGYAVLNITAAGPAELDKTLAAYLLPLSSSGVYAAGARVIGAATLPVIALLLTALPRLFREGQYRSKRPMRLIHWIFGAALTYSLMLAGVLWLMAPMVASLFGAGYTDLQQAIHWLTIAIPGMSLRMAAGNVLLTLNKPWARVAFEIVGLIVLFVAAPLLTSHLGIIGMSLALACSEWTMTIIGTMCILVITRSPTNPMLASHEIP